jgi:hypothetical protein
VRSRTWRRLAPALAAAGLFAAGPAVVRAQMEILPPEMRAKLGPATERPLALGPDGEALRFHSGAERWEEGMPPAIIDMDRDGTKDYIVMILEDGESGRRALLVREWGETADAFGRTVFYVIIEDTEAVAEWAGRPTLDLPVRPKP